MFPNDVREFEFAIEDGKHVYRSWLHSRPDEDGSWTFGSCKVTVRLRSGPVIEYRFLSNDGRRLIEVDGGEAVYRRSR